MKTRIGPPTITVICLLIPLIAHAQWAANGTAVCTANVGQYHPASVSDGAGGVIIAWEDARDGGGVTDVDVYVQRLDHNGYPLWTPGGIPVCTEINQQMTLTLVSDGANGAIIAWADSRSGSATIYAQRVSAAGEMLWTSDGVLLCTAPPTQDFPIAVTDGAGGAIVTWLDMRVGGFDIYAQRVNAAGVVQWPADGVAICTATGLQHTPFITSDGAGGAILAWTDERGITPDVYAQRINSAGAVQWTANGAAVCTASRVQNSGQVATDGAGGAIIAWVDGRNGNSIIFRDVYAQRMNGAGVAQWTLNGVPVCSAAGEQGYSNGVADGAGGAIFVWHDFRNSNWDLFAQRMNSAGVAQWTVGGLPVCTAVGTQWFAASTPDGAGGALVAWTDGRDGSGSDDIYTQRIDPTGAMRWTTNGVGVCIQPQEQHAQSVVSDGAGGAIVSYDDHRSWDGVTQPEDPYFDIYANRVTASGWSVTGVGNTPRSILSTNVPNPFSEKTSFNVVLDHEVNIVVDVFDVAGHRVRHMVTRGNAGVSNISFDGRDQRGNLLASGAYFYRVSANGTQHTRKMLIVR